MTSKNRFSTKIFKMYALFSDWLFALKFRLGILQLSTKSLHEKLTKFQSVVTKYFPSETKAIQLEKSGFKKY